MSLMQQLLDLVASENLATPASLARRLDVSPALVELMLADLERMGYLRPVEGGCPTCPTCGPQPACPPARPRLWVRTDK